MLMVDVTVRIYRILHGEFAYDIMVFMHEMSTYHKGTQAASTCKRREIWHETHEPLWLFHLLL